jgi:hypothetical protein
MAVVEITEPTKFSRVFIGLTADPRPTGVSNGAIYFEVKVDNTVLIYITPDGGANWRLIDIGDDVLVGIIGGMADAAVIVPSAVDTAMSYLKGILTQANLVKAQTDKIAAKMLYLLSTFWSDPQLGVTVPAAAGTLTLPAVVVAGLPTGAVVTHAKVLLTARVIENLNVALNKLNGATVAATSQVIQVQKGAGAWVDAICFIDDQLSIAGSTREGGPVLACSNTLATTITGNDTYSFRWLLARADLDSLYLQGVHMLIQLDYSI